MNVIGKEHIARQYLTLSGLKTLTQQLFEYKRVKLKRCINKIKAITLYRCQRPPLIITSSKRYDDWSFF